jgi:hypothetical protein
VRAVCFRYRVRVRSGQVQGMVVWKTFGEKDGRGPLCNRLRKEKGKEIENKTKDWVGWSTANRGETIVNVLHPAYVYGGEVATRS